MSSGKHCVFFGENSYENSGSLMTSTLNTILRVSLAAGYLQWERSQPPSFEGLPTFKKLAYMHQSCVSMIWTWYSAILYNGLNNFHFIM